MRIICGNAQYQDSDLSQVWAGWSLSEISWTVRFMTQTTSQAAYMVMPTNNTCRQNNDTISEYFSDKRKFTHTGDINDL